jgi:hypothetical protein
MPVIQSQVGPEDLSRRPARNAAKKCLAGVFGHLYISGQRRRFAPKVGAGRHAVAAPCLASALLIPVEGQTMALSEQQQPDAAEPQRVAKDSVNVSLPVLMLTILGTLIAVLGLFAAGEVALVIVGLVSIAVAGLIQIFTVRR